MKKFRPVLLMFLFMLALTPLKVEAKTAATYTYRKTVYVAVGETRSFSWGTFMGKFNKRGYYIRYYAGNMGVSSYPDSEIASASFWKQPCVTITGNKCGVTYMRFGLEDKNQNRIGRSIATIKVIEKPYITGKATMDIKQTIQFKTEGSDVVKWWSKNKKVATVSKEGVVTTKKTGKTVIYAKGKSGRVCSKTLTVKHKHKYSKTKTVKPTCTKDGYKVNVCKCGKEKDKTVYKKKLGHSYRLSSSVSQSCTKDGYKVEYCKRCGEKKKTVLKMYGHSFTAAGSESATCEKDGYEKEECKRCGNTRRGKTLPATGHKFKDYVVTDSTCTEQGGKSGECLNCNEIIVLEEYPLADHDFELHEVSPTCEDKGYSWNECRVCHLIKDEVTLPATGHVVGDYKVGEESTFMLVGDEYAECACGKHREVRAIPRKDYVSEVIEVGGGILLGDGGWRLLGEEMKFSGIWDNGRADTYVFTTEVTHFGGNDFNVKVYHWGILGLETESGELFADKDVSVPQYTGDASSERGFKRYWHSVNGGGIFLNFSFFEDYVFDDFNFRDGANFVRTHGKGYVLN